VGINFHVLVPLLAAGDASVGPSAFGLLAASFGAGALLGALLSATLARASWAAIVLATTGFSASILALAPAHRPAVAAVLLFTTGAFFTLESSNSQSILQLTAPDHIRGRVLSLYLLAFGGFAPIGGLVAGWLAEQGGVDLAFTIAGLSGLVGALLLAAARIRRPRLLTAP
jgi:MFS family permease